MTYDRPSLAVRGIMLLPAGRSFSLRMWNRVQRLRGEVAARTWYGSRLRCDARDIIQASIVHFGVWEPALSRALHEMAEPGDVVVDIGANIGYFSLLLADRVGPAGTVVAIEALPQLAERVRRHGERNGFANIRVVNAAVTAEPMAVTMFAGPDSNSGASTTRADYGYQPSCVVEGLPLADLLTPEERARTTIVKCDIEGAELPVMKQLLDQLDLYPALRVVAVEANTENDPEWAVLFDRFIRRGFAAFQLPTDIAETWRNALAGRDMGPPIGIAALPGGTSDLLLVRRGG